MMWFKILAVVVACVALAIYHNQVANVDLAERNKLAAQQLDDNGAAGIQLQEEQVDRNDSFVIYWLLLGVVSTMLLWTDVKKMFKYWSAGVACLFVLTMTGCWRPYEPVVLKDIGTNEEAFLLPYVGDTKDQVATTTEAYLKSNMVHAKQVRIPQQWVQTGYRSWNGEWRDAALLVKVDKAPVTREWTADKDSGTSNKNEAIWVMTSDQVEFSTGWTCTARIESKDDAVLFLHNYPNGSLQAVLDGEVRGKLQAVFGLAVTDRPMEELRREATPHIKQTVDEITMFFKKRGITISTLGITGGFVYKDPKIMQAMVDLFISEQGTAKAKAETLAQEEMNKKTLSMAKAKADAILAEREAEATGIKSVADAKAYELEKAKEDLASYMELKRLEIAKAQLEKWDGKFPTYFMGTTSPNTLLQIPFTQEVKPSP